MLHCKIYFQKLIVKFIVKFIDYEYFLKLIEVSKFKKYLKIITIGKKSYIYNEAEIYNLQNDKSKILIGNNTHIRGELLIYPYGNGIKIGDYSYIGKNTIIRAADEIIIGDNVLISHSVTIIDTDSHEIDYKQRSQSFSELLLNGHSKTKGEIKTAPIKIEDNVWINNNVCILKGISIGHGSIVGAGSIVTKDVQPFTIVAGNPAIFIKKIENEKVF